MKIAQVFVDVATSHPVDRVLKVAIAVPTQARPLGPRADGWLLKCLAEEHGCLCLSGLQTHLAVHGVWQLQGRHSFQKPPENQAVGKIQWLDRLDVKWKPKHHCGGIGGDGPSSLGLVFMSLVGGSVGHHTLRNHGDYMAASDLRVVQVGPSVQERLREENSLRLRQFVVDSGAASSSPATKANGSSEDCWQRHRGKLQLLTLAVAQFKL